MNPDSPLGTTGVGTDDDSVLPIGDLLLDIAHHAWFRPQVVDWNVEEALDLRSVQVHCDNVVRSSHRQEVCDESTPPLSAKTLLHRAPLLVHSLCRDWRPRLVLLVLPGIWVARDDGRDSLGRSCPARWTEVRCFPASHSLSSPEIMMSSSIKWSLIRGGLGDCRMKTSSSRTDEWIWTEVSSDRNFETWHGVRAIPSLRV